jgi:acetoin utilization deacetylase AcuC-like enzyme
MGITHPESPFRLQAITQALQRAPFSPQLHWQEALLATKEQLKRVHGSHYVDEIFAIAPSEGYLQLDPDTLMNPFSLPAALRAAGALVQAVDLVFTDQAKRVFCLVRPPGHHAEPSQAMGFCFFNNIAVGVAHALATYHCKRLAVVDFDVHHGNGTEAMLLHEPKVCFWSSFQHPFYPGTVLTGKPKHIHLCPLAAGTRSDTFRNKVALELVPLLEEWQPECIFISAGFDAHQQDPLANLMLSTDDYAFVTQEVCKVADKYAKGRVISTLEGGYNLQALAASVSAHVEGLLLT